MKSQLLQCAGRMFRALVIHRPPTWTLIADAEESPRLPLLLADEEVGLRVGDGPEVTVRFVSRGRDGDKIVLRFTQ